MCREFGFEKRSDLVARRHRSAWHDPVLKTVAPGRYATCLAEALQCSCLHVLPRELPCSLFAMPPCNKALPFLELTPRNSSHIPLSHCSNVGGGSRILLLGGHRAASCLTAAGPAGPAGRRSSSRAMHAPRARPQGRPGIS